MKTLKVLVFLTAMFAVAPAMAQDTSEPPIPTAPMPPPKMGEKSKPEEPGLARRLFTGFMKHGLVGFIPERARAAFMRGWNTPLPKNSPDTYHHCYDRDVFGIPGAQVTIDRSYCGEGH